MCGITGLVSLNGKTTVTDLLVRKLLDPIRHRGPDDSGVYSDGRFGFGHSRLSIIDVKGGHQPIWNDNKTKCIVFNGEIYNYLELREDLLKAGHRFATVSDTEVILRLHEEKGKECVKELRGMFAFAIWDSEDNTIFIARDRLGIKPLYYYMDSNLFCFSSEIKSILKLGVVNAELNLAQLDLYVGLNYTIGPETMFKNIFKLMPGHQIILKEGNIRESQYWDFNEIKEIRIGEREAVEEMDSLIEECVKSHLMSEVPLGAFLSGGIDSSLIVSYMARLTQRTVKTFTVGYEDAPEESELEFARIVADHFKTEHHEIILKPNEFMDILPSVIWHLDEPIAEYATLPLLLLSKLAKKHVTVMMSGEGADEILAGYPIYRFMGYINRYQKLPGLIRDYLTDPLLNKMIGKKKGGKYMEWFKNPLEKRYVGNGSYFTRGLRNKLYTSEFKASIDMNRLDEIVDGYYKKVSHKDSIQKMLYLDTKTWLPEDLLIKADKMTMAASLELRVPFLDHKLVEYAASLPSKLKATLFQSKYILKKIGEKYLPENIVYRKKKGFPVPLKQWLRSDVRKMAQDILLDHQTKQRGIFDRKSITNLFEIHDSGKEDLSCHIWNLLIFELWMRTFIDGSTRAQP